MPKEMFVSCVGDLATLGGSVGLDPSPFSPWFLLFFLVCETLGFRKFSYPGDFLMLWPSGVHERW